MATITIDVPDDISVQLNQMRDRLPELLTLSLQQPAVPASLYRSILSFLASKPTPQEIIAFRPDTASQERLRTLIMRSQIDQLTQLERVELDEFERIEHFIVMLKLDYLSTINQSV